MVQIFVFRRSNGRRDLYLPGRSNTTREVGITRQVGVRCTVHRRTHEGASVVHASVVVPRFTLFTKRLCKGKKKKVNLIFSKLEHTTCLRGTLFLQGETWNS